MRRRGVVGPLLAALACLAQAALAAPPKTTHPLYSSYCDSTRPPPQPTQAPPSSRLLAAENPRGSIMPAVAAEPIAEPDLPSAQATPVHRTPSSGGDLQTPPNPPAGVPLTLEAALEWTLSGNPDLVTVRQNLPVSAEAVRVARRWPMSLNPTVSVTVQPWVFERSPESGTIDRLQPLVSVSWMQPIELGRRTSFRTSIAQAAYSQARWQILQAELLALVQTYRFHQTATYRREKFRVAVDLAEFNIRLLEALRRQMEANQIPASDVLLAEVENQSTSQQVATAQQEYVSAVAELRQQLGLAQQVGWVEPVGRLRLPEGAAPDSEAALLQAALACRPEIQAARAQLSGSEAAVRLSRAERIPVPSIGPAYEKDESGVSFYGVSLSMPVPVLNTGKTLVRQKEAEHRRDAVALQQVQEKVSVQVKAALVRWQQAQQLVERTNSLTEPIRGLAARMQRLFEAGQADLVKLFQVRRRLIEAENTQLDALWQANQAYADLLAALGATPLLGSLRGQTQESPDQ